jgi:von Willebrand factor type A domain
MLIAIAAVTGLLILVLAFFLYRLAWARRRSGSTRESAPDGDSIVQRHSVWDDLRFMAGPFPLSISLHVLVLLALLWGVHLEQGRNLISVDLQAGGGGGRADELKQLDMPEMAMPETSAPLPIERPTIMSQSTTAVSVATRYVRMVVGQGIGAGRGGGIGSSYGRGIGAGFGGFIGGLRRTGLDVTIVIDGTGSMRLIIDEVKGKMKQLVLAIHRLVPTARIGIVVFGGRGEPLQVEALTLSPDKLLFFLNNIQAHNGGEWQEDTLGAVRTAVDRMGWRPEAKKVIVLVGDTPPFDEDTEPVLGEVRKFTADNGTFNTVDVTVEEHERFIEDWAQRTGQQPQKNSPLPGFYVQTQHAYQAVASAGGGSWHSLTKDDQINQQVLMLAFGAQWQTEVAAFGRGITSRSAASDP